MQIHVCEYVSMPVEAKEHLKCHASSSGIHLGFFFFLIIKKIILFLIICMWVCVLESRYLWRPEEGVGSPGTGFSGGFEILKMHAVT